MTSRPGLALAAVLAFFAIPTRSQEIRAQVAPVVSFCEVVANPRAYDGKAVSVRARVSREFEDFTLFDPNCYEKPDIWIELGGDAMVKDESLKTFLKLLSARQSKKAVYRVAATLTGRFLGENPKQDKRLRPALPGYGHMGCCFQLIVSQVSNVTSSTQVQDRNEEWKKRGVPSPEKLRH